MDISTQLIDSPAGKGWKNVRVRQHHGICLPLFSLRSHSSGGIGEFTDLIPLVDWCKEVGFDVIQMLPLNDNGHGQGPYGAISAMALNPLNLGLSALPEVLHDIELQNILNDLKLLNKKQRVSYEEVISGKDHFLQIYFNKYSESILKSTAYQDFVNNNSWLQGYSLFKALKIANDWRAWTDWSPELHQLTTESYNELCHKYERAISYHTLIQFLCFQQFEKVYKLAHEKGIFLKGDIPILISKDSADVWLHKWLFNLNLTAGAPADAFAEEGQNWHFPLYNWENIEKDNNYGWWKERLRIAGQFYDIYRIDHIVGFYRIWAIPLGSLAKEGHFEPKDESLWIPHGEKIMRMMLSTTEMLPIGEDLGTVPPEVRVNMRSLGICGTRVIRWERLWEEDKSFVKYKDYIPESMTTVSTHDTETLQMWWQNPHEGAPEFALFKGWDYNPELTLEQRREILRDSHHTGSLFHINLLGEYLAMQPMLTWPNIEDERINVPSVNTETNWTYRMRPFLENLVQNEKLKKEIRDLIH